MRKPFIAGNWKMFKTRVEAVSFARKFKNMYMERGKTDVDVAVCAPYLHLESLKEIFDGTDIGIGAQNVHFEDEGAYTGEISVLMLDELGTDYCIVGHSERRQYFAETDETVNKKLHKLFETPIIPIMCVGEVLAEREAGKEKAKVEEQVTGGLKGLSADQVAGMVIAYEPVWAIGTGKTATPEQANEMCAHIRSVVRKLYDDAVADQLIIQYGGSVKPKNASEIMGMPDIDGALVGGASLVPEDFLKIIDF